MRAAFGVRAAGGYVVEEGVVRRTVTAIAGLVLLATTTACGQSSLHSADLGTTSATPPPTTTPATPAPAPRQQPLADAAQPGLPTVAELLDTVHRQALARHTAHYTYTAALGATHTARPVDTGLLSWNGAEPDLDHTAQEPAVTGTATVPDHRIFLGGVLYENVVPGLMAFRAPDGRPWLRIADQEPSAKARIRLQDERELAAALLPTVQLAGFRDAAKVSATAPDQRQGRPATRYDITVDVAQASTMVTAPELTALLASAQRGHQPQLHYRLWLAPDQLPLAVTSDLPAPDSEPGTQTVEYRDWGTKLPITAPNPKLTCTTKDLHPA